MDLNLTFILSFIVENKNNIKINSKLLFKDFEFLKNKTTYEILNAQRIATESIFKKIPYRSFYIRKRNEETLGKLFCFFTLEVILLSHLLKVDPLNQLAVELVKKETFKILKIKQSKYYFRRSIYFFSNYLKSVIKIIFGFFVSMNNN